MAQRGQISWAVFGAVMLCAVVSASAQVPPPSRDRGNNGSGRDVPHYVDSADYDPQPYYVDGVEYKPYAPDKKKGKPAAATASSAAQPVTPSAPAPQPQPGELHPYVPPSSIQAKPEPEARPAVQAAASSSSTSTAAYVPKKRPRYGSAIIEALDKVTAESVRFEAPVGQPVRYKGLIYLVRACETSADDESQSDVFAYMQVRTAPVDATNTSAAVKSKEIFHGWTFASSPSLNPLQHPVYDAWVVGCRKPMAS